MCFKEIDGHQIYSHTARTPIYGNLRDFGILTMWVGPLVPHDMLEPPIRCYGSHCTVFPNIFPGWYLLVSSIRPCFIPLLRWAMGLVA